LALDQAGAYIRARRLQLREFMPHYNKRKAVILSELRKLSLLQILDKQTGETRFSIYPVVRDWMKLRKSNHMQQQFAPELAVMPVSYMEKVAIDDISLETKQETNLHLIAATNATLGYM
jgi:hypothetical protein